MTSRSSKQETGSVEEAEKKQPSNPTSTWIVKYASSHVEKGRDKLSKARLEDFKALVRDLQVSGNNGGKGWPNFGSLQKLNNKEYQKRFKKYKKYHCHLNSGQPAIVVVWVEYSKIEKKLLIIYVGPHEGAPY